ncbi:MAG: hypothetical protein GY838_07525 [bacterium]|nr:hypothetical protein [bacterium]
MWTTRRCLPLALCLCATLAIIAVAAPPAADHAEFAVADYATRLHHAAAAERPLLVEFTTKKCGSCRQFAEALGGDDKLAAAAQQVPTVKIESWSEDGVRLVKQHRVVAYPTFLLVDDQGREIDRWVGWEDAATWINLVETALTDLSLIPDKKLNFAAAPTAVTGEILGRNAYWMGRTREAVEYYAAAQRLAPNRAHDLHHPIFLALTDRAVTAADLPEIEAAAGAMADCPRCTDRDLVRLGYGMLGVADQLGDPQVAAPWLRRVLDRTAASTEARVVRSRVKFAAKLPSSAGGN